MAVKPCREKWKGTMTDRERFNNQMHYKPIDRCFNMEFGYWEENFREWPIFVENGITSNAMADRFFNFDVIRVVAGNTWMHPAFQEGTTRSLISSSPRLNRRRIGNASRKSDSDAMTRPGRSTSKSSRRPIPPTAIIPSAWIAAR